VPEGASAALAAPAAGAGRRRPPQTGPCAPLRAFLEARGGTVKGRVRGCDLLARRGEEPPVIVELTMRFTPAPALQGVERPALGERASLAVPRDELRRPRNPAGEFARRAGNPNIGGARGTGGLPEAGHAALIGFAEAVAAL
jgi:hypothetical protein